ncbi:hypothetical protein ABB37_02120 [Leptomonas pyrrhocoris]|uniref:Uncharacterized protein n=1 Tax=Leptomonas pyrrhocoris TaxID=157538 RepID=A0A0M9G7J0_LEPPY|nr:hypothetical protein ABB37_02120 [Leptomonas pyrrhocoris]KPA83976.1 hypothetical protein ABB37_02120 [Leptomonas pyrrhocoris]|eukprot:XP_015662415.1 hypothetical protein ABB37_02120 [Leptomonas pyrrhocoris]
MFNVAASASVRPCRNSSLLISSTRYPGSPTATCVEAAGRTATPRSAEAEPPRGHHATRAAQPARFRKPSPGARFHCECAKRAPVTSGRPLLTPVRSTRHLSLQETNQQAARQPEIISKVLQFFLSSVCAPSRIVAGGCGGSAVCGLSAGRDLSLYCLFLCG